MKRLAAVLFAGFLFANTNTVYYKTLYDDTGDTLADIQSTGVEYLNYLRNSAGMISLNLNPYLNTAAQNHSNYCVINNYAGHEEYSGYEGFTGEWPSDRVVYAGYKSKMVLENLSTNNKDVNDSIDKLFSAIYHRFGFLDESIDEIGIGYAAGGDLTNVYTYDMGNSYLNELCTMDFGDVTGYYYTNVCADDSLEIPLTVLDSNNSINMAKNPQIIIWPFDGDQNIAPVFYEETPDPLPDYSVSGYPVSIKFNKYYFKNPPTLISFKLYDQNMSEVDDTLLLTSQNDPNYELSDYEYALFPLQRLEWGEKYYVQLEYFDNDSNETKTLSWSFKTRALNIPYFTVTQDVTLNVLPNKTYALYFKPQNPDDVISSFQYSYSCDDINASFIDRNTIEVSISGDVGTYATLLIPDRNVKLVISDTESAFVYPMQSQAQDSDDVSGVIDSLPAGWHIVAFSEEVNFTAITSQFKIIWSYDNGKWCGYSNIDEYKDLLVGSSQYCESVGSNQAFWILK